MTIFKLDDFYPDVIRLLESWTGYETLRDVMDQHRNLQVFIAGGVIRNHLLGKSSRLKDFDFFISGPRIDSALRHFSFNGPLRHTPFGAPRWYPNEDAEQYADLIPVTDFKPGLWQCEDIVDVLNQFDFTANALAFDLRTGRGFDPQNGFRDVRRRTMRMIRFDYPDEPFVPGASLTRHEVLWFRVLHYASDLGLTIEPLTLEWLRIRKHYAGRQKAFVAAFFPVNGNYLDPVQHE